MNTTQHYFGKQKTPRVIYRIINPDGSDDGHDYSSYSEAIGELADCTDVEREYELVKKSYLFDCEGYRLNQETIDELKFEAIGRIGYRIIDVLI